MVKTYFCRGRIVAALAAGLLLCGLVAADAPKGKSKLDQVGRLNEVAAQKIESDVRTALMAAQRTDKPQQAAERLKQVLARLEDDTTLSKDRRDNLLSMLRARIKTLENSPAQEALNEKDLQAAIQRLEQKKQDGKKNEEQEKLRRRLNTVLELQKEGKVAEARKAADELAKDYPAEPTVAAAVRNTSALEQLASAKEVRLEKERKTAQALRDVEKSAIPPAGDIEFPKDWKERTKRRKPFDYVPLTAKEQAILRALNSPVSVNFDKERFQDVLEYLSTVMDQPILVDKKALEDANINYETPVSLAVRGATARTVLKRILGEFGLVYVIQNGTIQVVPAAQAKEIMVARSYYVGDLVNFNAGGQLQMAQSVAGIIDTIQNSIDPPSWQANGGPGTIQFHFPTMSLVIRQSAEVHGMISSSLLR